MFIAFISDLFQDMFAYYHFVPNDAAISFGDGEDTDLPIVLI